MSAVADDDELNVRMSLLFQNFCRPRQNVKPLSLADITRENNRKPFSFFGFRLIRLINVFGVLRQINDLVYVRKIFCLPAVFGYSVPYFLDKTIRRCEYFITSFINLLRHFIIMGKNGFVMYSADYIEIIGPEILHV